MLQRELSDLSWETHNLQCEDFSEYLVFKFCDEAVIPKDTGLAYCITTSGTTGSPKVVRVPHQCIVPNIVDLRCAGCTYAYLKSINLPYF